jgi:hypothetical protein
MYFFFTFLKLTLIFSILQHGSRREGQQGGTYFNNPEFAEATRLIELKLTLINPQDIPDYYTLIPRMSTTRRCISLGHLGACKVMRRPSSGL